MGKEYQIDSNVIIDYLDNIIPEEGVDMVINIIDAEPNISVITKIEVLRYNTANAAYEILQDFILVCNILVINDNIIKKIIKLCRQHMIKLPDAIIAATALVNSLILVIRNTSDFKNIFGLEVINPHGI